MSDTFRWQALFQRVCEPVFVLNRYRRILFVNRAWEELTGVTATEARGLSCTRRGKASDDKCAMVTRALWPPPEVVHGRPAQVRRQFGLSSVWWDIDFLPLRDDDGMLCILCRVTGIPLKTSPGFEPFSDALRTLHDGLVRNLPAEQAVKVWKPEEIIGLRESLASQHRLESLESDLPSMQRVQEQARLASKVRACTFIVGEHGTGKRWLARAIHQLGYAKEKGFAALDCARLSAAALSEALFGTTGLYERTSIGTLYLREPARLTHDLQARLSDWAQQDRADEQSQRPRLIAGSRHPPMEEMRAGRLHEKLYADLSTLLIELPTLRERMADLPALVSSILERLNSFTDRRIVGLTPAAWELVREYRWPGNVRELYQTLQVCHGNSATTAIDAAELPPALRQTIRLESTDAPAAERPMPLDQFLEQAERRLIGLALHRARGNKSKAADLLAVWRPRLLRRMEALGIKQSPEPEA
jgi:PAS domain S-box-containing protein